jgi:hypothetical protein
MVALVLVSALLAIAGGSTGYRAAGIGGAILCACLFGVTAIVGLALLFRMAILARRAWLAMLLLGLVALAALLSWGVQL